MCLPTCLFAKVFQFLPVKAYNLQRYLRFNLFMFYVFSLVE